MTKSVVRVTRTVTPAGDAQAQAWALLPQFADGVRMSDGLARPLRIAGYAAGFGQQVADGRVIESGALRTVVLDRYMAAGAPLLFEHGGSPIGKVITAILEPAGLWIEALLTIDQRGLWAARAILHALALGTALGLSVNFLPSEGGEHLVERRAVGVDAGVGVGAQGVVTVPAWVVTDVERLNEISVTSAPANPMCTVQRLR
jgi:phage head maturation protease